MSWKAVLVFSLVLTLSFSGLAQPSMPHRVFGDVTDDGEEVGDIGLEFRYDGGVVAETETDSDGYYDIQVPYSSEYEGEELVAYVNDTETEATIEHTSGASERLHIEVDFIQDTNEAPQQGDQGNQGSQGGSGGSGGGGGLPSGAFEDDNNETSNQTQDNQTDTDLTTNNITENDTEDTVENETQEINQTEESDNNGNLITGLFALNPSSIGQALDSFFSGIIDLFTSLV